MKYSEIEDYTLAEIYYIVNTWLARVRAQRKWEAELAWWQTTTNAVAYHEPKKLPKHPREVFPDLFDEVDDEEIMQQKFLAGARMHNIRMKGE